MDKIWGILGMIVTLFIVGMLAYPRIIETMDSSSPTFNEILRSAEEKAQQASDSAKAATEAAEAASAGQP